MDVKALLRTPPRPIIDSRNRIVLLWSAKAGCTFAVKWLLNHMGLLDEALAYNPWIHRYRMDRLYQSHQHDASVKDFCKSPSSYRVVKFVREPFKRAVSSYVHASIYGYEDSRISTSLGRVVDDKSRFTFREFVSYLASINLRRCNIHHQLQTHELEHCVIPSPSFVINLDHSMESIPKLEAFWGLSQTDPWLYRESAHHTQTSSDASDQFSGDIAFNTSRRSAPVVPPYRTFYDMELEDQVYTLYAEDFLRYGFSTTLNATQTDGANLASVSR